MTIAVDFDGTIVTHEYPNIGKPIPFAFETLKLLQSEGHHNIILWTAREDELLQEALDFCKKHGLEFYAVNTNFPGEEELGNRGRKVHADVFIDDHNLGGLPDWGIIYKMIMSGSPLKPFRMKDDEEQSRKQSWCKRLLGF